jgi:hypothetical protein
MPAVIFRQCSCGVEFKILYIVDETKQFYTCTNCQQIVEIVGTVLNMYTCPASTFGRERNWTEIPKDKLRTSP